MAIARRIEGLRLIRPNLFEVYRGVKRRIGDVVLRNIDMRGRIGFDNTNLVEPEIVETTPKYWRKRIEDKRHESVHRESFLGKPLCQEVELDSRIIEVMDG